MKTIRQIADEIGVSKQTVYKRYKANCIRFALRMRIRSRGFFIYRSRLKP